MVSPEDVSEAEFQAVLLKLAKTDQELYQLLRVATILTFSEYIAAAEIDKAEALRELIDQLDRFAVQVTITQGEVTKTQTALQVFFKRLSAAIQSLTKQKRLH